jgi:hypothetical protein
MFPELPADDVILDQGIIKFATVSTPSFMYFVSNLKCTMELSLNQLSILISCCYMAPASEVTT